MNLNEQELEEILSILEKYIEIMYFSGSTEKVNDAFHYAFVLNKFLEDYRLGK